MDPAFNDSLVDVKPSLLRPPLDLLLFCGLDSSEVGVVLFFQLVLSNGRLFTLLPNSCHPKSNRGNRRCQRNLSLPPTLRLLPVSGFISLA
ncbi:hypothetical protein TNCT_602491 [Trichonephila clavata]|uniref:Uncharacterized protein n=1 Tax=Trichonephila clavata TaxID=2740835 RepID=A0A8X6FNX0_TRICU|nr:hypothetical protein TNCT_602491 [Trichonephila clavata]